MIRTIITSVILLIVVTLTGCTENGPLDVLSKETDISFSAGKIVSDYDSHGGFHGDGTRLITVVFPENPHTYSMEKQNFKFSIIYVIKGRFIPAHLHGRGFLAESL